VQLQTVPRSEVDLRDQAAVFDWFAKARPQAVFLAAAKVGGIVANNTLRGEFIYDNLIMSANVIHAAYVNGVEKLMFLGSSCIYPKRAAQPLREDSILTGPLEETNEPYAIAKIAGIKLVEAYRSQYGCDFINVMPTNLYGPGDNYHPEYSHVVAALIRRFHEAKVAGQENVLVWGTGAPRREFLYVDDLADACIFLMKNYSGDELVNIGTGEDITVADLPAWWPASSAITARSVTIPHGPTARRRSCSMSADSPSSAGAPAPRSRTGSGSLIAPISASTRRRRSSWCRLVDLIPPRKGEG